MDYTALAETLLQHFHALRKGPHHKKLDESMRGETFVVIFIGMHGGSVLPGEISTNMGISSARIAAALNSLERKGLVTRQIDTSDRRRILVNLTPEGQVIAEAHRQEMLSSTVGMLEFLGETDAQEFVRIIVKLADHMLQCHKGN